MTGVKPERPSQTATAGVEDVHREAHSSEDCLVGGGTDNRALVTVGVQDGPAPSSINGSGQLVKVASLDEVLSRASGQGGQAGSPRVPRQEGGQLVAKGGQAAGLGHDHRYVGGGPRSQDRD